MARKVIKWTKAEWDAFWQWLKEPAQGATEDCTDPWYCDSDWEDPPDTVGPDFVMSEADYFGEMRWQGDDERKVERKDLWEGIDLAEAIKNWQRSRKVVTLVVEFDREREAEVKAALKELNLKIVK